MPWIEKYRPKNFEDVKGQAEAVIKVKNFLKIFPKKKAVVLHGPPGVGKTTLVHVIANELDSEILELNASDFRDKERLQSILKPAIEQKSLMRKGKIILVDEVDGISGYYDRGGISELLQLINSTTYPIVLTANDIWGKKFSALRRKTEIIQLKDVDYKVVKEILIGILERENLFMNPNILTTIAVRSKGDIRAAINDLQSSARMQDPSLITFDERNKKTDIFNSLKQVFKTKPTNDTLRIFDSVKMPIDEIILWVEENVCAEYQGKALARALDLLSRVDIFRRRIYRQQYWRFLVYENIFLSYGISASKKNIKSGFTAYKRPTRILKMWMNNQRTVKKKSIAKKYAEYVHVGEKRAMREFSVIKQILTNPKIREELKLSEEEVEYLEK